MILHELDQGVDGLTSEVGFAAPGQRVRLVDQEHAAERLLDHGAGLHRRLADVARHQERAIRLDQVALGEHAQRSVDLRQQAGDGGLSRSRVAAEHQVQAGVEDGEVPHLPELLYLQQVRQLSDRALDLPQAHQPIEIRQELLERWWLVLTRSGPWVGRRPTQSGAVERADQGGAESVDGVLAVAGGGVDGGRLRALHRPRVVAMGVLGARALIGREQQGEQLGRFLLPAPPLQEVVRGARRDGVHRAAVAPDEPAHCPRVLVGLDLGHPPVGRHHRGDQRVGLVDDHAPERPRPRRQTVEDGGDLLDEAVHRRDECTRGHGCSTVPAVDAVRARRPCGSPRAVSRFRRGG